MRGLMRQGCQAVAAATMALLTLAGTASAEPSRPVSQSCMALTDFGVCSVGRVADGLWKVAVAPGGWHAYGIAHNAQAIMIFDRDPATGALTQRPGTAGCVSASGSGCTPGRGLVAVNGIVLSPDGANVYVTGGGGGSPAGTLSVFDRAPSGDLTQKPGLAGCLTADGAYAGVAAQCAVGRGISGAATLLMSPDGRQVYTGPATIGVFQRDPATGTLTQAPDAAGCAANNGAFGCTPTRNLGAGRQMALSADGRSLYAPANALNTITIFDRDPTSGALRQKDGAAGCVGAANGCTAERRMLNPLAITTTSDARNVYVSVADGVLTFARAGDGSVTLQSCVNNTGSGDCSAGRNLRGVSYGAGSPDGQSLVFGQEPADSPGIVVFDRDAQGNLTQPQGADGCVTPTGAAWIGATQTPNQCGVQPALGGNGQPTFVDDHSFIAASYYSSAAVAFKRDLYPQCADRSFSLAQNLAAPLPFSCTDRNGDPMSYTITGNPIAGAVGAVDQTAARVFYNPFLGYLGDDTVRYRAQAAGLVSNEASLAISVVVPTVPTPAAARPRTVNAPVSYNWFVKGSRLTIRRLVVSRLPVGSIVTITCTGKRCPFKTRTIKRSRKSTMNVLNAKALKGRKSFRAGQSVDVRIAAPGMNTKVLRFKLKSKTVPKHRTYCVPLGEKRAKSSC